MVLLVLWFSSSCIIGEPVYEDRTKNLVILKEIDCYRERFCVENNNNNSLFHTGGRSTNKKNK